MDIIPRRSRITPKATTGIVGITNNDAEGFFEPLTRYGYLPTNHLVEFDKRYIRTRHKRLSKFFQETEKWAHRDKPIVRYTDPLRFSINAQAQYRLGPAAYKFMKTPDELREWIEKTRIGPFFDNHDVGLNVSVSSIEIAAKRAGIRFINHLEILRGASQEAQRADRPLNIPIPDGIRWKLQKGFRETKATHLAPDAIFGLEYPQGVRFFAVEYDKGTEVVMPSSDLDRPSWLRKVLCYQAVSKGLLEKHLGIPKLHMLAIIPSEERMGNILEAFKRVYTSGTEILAAVHPPVPVGAYSKIPAPSDFLFTTDWQRVGHPPLNLSRI